jgi:hypothetical protein
MTMSEEFRKTAMSVPAEDGYCEDATIDGGTDRGKHLCGIRCERPTVEKGGGRAATCQRSLQRVWSASGWVVAVGRACREIGFLMRLKPVEIRSLGEL